MQSFTAILLISTCTIEHSNVHKHTLLYKAVIFVCLWVNHVAFLVATVETVGEAVLPAHYKCSESHPPLTIKENITQSLCKQYGTLYFHSTQLQEH